ncbi:cellulose synthase [Tanacetum coccineum]|uniref:Cellulose synthase n=1 Tax=Tanacetum coccineum TaxID=301880 RepID=A0ABQ5CHX5_9ASTR
MAASSLTAPFSLDIFHSGYLKLKPLTYIDSEMVTMNIDVTGFKFKDMKEYVESKTHSIVIGLYYFNKGLNNIKCDADFTLFVEKWQSNEGRLAQLYVDHNNADLGDYIGKDLGDYILVELKPGYNLDDSDDEFSDVASLDHLSEGESDDNDREVDPLFSNLDDDIQKEKVHVEPEINSDKDMPIMDEDENVQWSRARRITLYNLKQNVGSQYERLIDYASELRKTNPGITVQLSIDPLADDGYGITFIYDRHKRLIQAVRRVVPRVEHRLCARHIYANFNKVYPGVLFRKLFWQASKASYHQKFKNRMEEIKTASAEAYQYLVDKDPCTWSRVYFKEGMDCDVVKNGLSESFNSHIKNARRKPIIGMLEDIRSYVMTRNYTLWKKCEDWKSEIFPNIRKVLKLHKKIQSWMLLSRNWMANILAFDCLLWGVLFSRCSS